MIARIPAPRSWLAGAVVLAAGLAAVVVPGTSQAGLLPQVPTDGPVSDHRAVALLRAAYQAGTSLSFHGTAFVGVDDSFVQVRVHHVPGEGTWVSTMDGDDSTVSSDARPGLADLSPLQLLGSRYQLTYGGLATVSGHRAYVVLALRGDGTPAAKFWIDRRTALVLARSSYDDEGTRYEQVVFTDLQVDSPAAHTDPPTPVAEPQPVAPLAKLRSDGWYVERDLPGGFELYDVRVQGSGEHAVLHLSYTDGLCTMSVFEEHGRLSAGALQGWQSTDVAGRTVYADGGAPQRLAWQGVNDGRDTVYALLSDAAPARVVGVVSELPHGSSSDGVLDRMKRGFDRLGSWLDPFD